MKLDLNGKVAIVTGAAKGIGTAIAFELAEAGAEVALIDLDQKELQATEIEFREKGHDVMAFHGDVIDSDFIAETITKIMSSWSNIDVLVNNAGIIRDNFLQKISEDDWDKVLAVNLKGPFLWARAVAGHMRANQSGKIVNIISRAWLGNIGQSNYSSSKGGLVSLTRTLALELARFQIHVNGVAPGLIDTPMTQGMPQKSRDRLIQMQPTKKMGTVKDIAAAVCFLASERANFITGQILHVDGGKSCGLLSL